MKASTARRLALEHLRQVTIRRRLAQARARAAGLRVISLEQIGAAMARSAVEPLAASVRQVLQEVRDDLGEDDVGPARH